MTTADSSQYGVAVSFGTSPASLGSRLVAQIIDGVVGVMPLLLFAAMANVNRVWTGPAVLTLFLFFVYYLFCDGLPNGQSVGKRLLKIRVVIDETGLPCTYPKSFLRNITQVLGILDWLWIFGGKRKRAGDFLAHTSVVNA